MVNRLLVVLSVLFLCLGLASLSGHAGAQTVQTAKRSPAVQICNNQLPQLCMNRAGGGSTQGTTVTAFDADDIHGSFEGVTLSGRCNAGHVSSAQHCPFTNQAYNVTYNNDRIMSLEEYVDDWCVGTAGATLFTTRLEGCPTPDGAGGGWDTQWVWNGAGSTFNCIINIEKTNANGDGSHVWAALSNGRSNAITIATGNNSPCSNAALWKEFFN